MDDTDRKLLAAITENARKPVKQAAEEAGVSRETADYRIKKLEKRGIIQGYKARLNLSRFKGTHIMFLRLKRWEGREELHVLDSEFFREAKYPHWIGRASGIWDVLFFFSTDDLDGFLDDVFDHFGSNLKGYRLLSLNTELKDSHASLFGRAEPTTSYAGDHEEELDGKDRKILSMLSEDAKRTNKEIAEEVSLTDEAVRYRIKRLEDKQIILGYRAIIDLKAAGYTQYAVAMELSGMTSEEKEQLQQRLAHHPGTVYAADTLGEHSTLAIIAAKSLEDFDENIRELRNEFAQHLNELEITPVLESKHPSIRL